MCSWGKSAVLLLQGVLQGRLSNTHAFKSAYFDHSPDRKKPSFTGLFGKNVLTKPLVK
ncbi:hypothetical protein NEPTK9_001661 [Candidatus Neptunochlamydia vexilliferae]|uniref:Uncharacterized protein n=1 Tax=Candidatus Neptunichlamydia vexilliferae TaxID=1651774 RepID=A0ABS0B145_9BACT|nr:hypothetical protein [Candidatus Neptunochlamydia vexilliferae]